MHKNILSVSGDFYFQQNKKEAVMKKIKALLLVSLMTLSMTLTACGGTKGSANGGADTSDNGAGTAAGQNIADDNAAGTAGDAMDGTASDVKEAVEESRTDNENVNDVTAGDTAEGDSLLNDVGDAVGDVGNAAADVIEDAAEGVENAVDDVTNRAADSKADSSADTHSASSGR